MKEPSPAAMAAAKAIADCDDPIESRLLVDTWTIEEIATIIDKHFAPELTRMWKQSAAVVEALEYIADRSNEDFDKWQVAMTALAKLRE